MNSQTDMFTKVFEKSNFQAWLEDLDLFDDLFIDYLGDDHASVQIDGNSTLFVDFTSFDHLFTYAPAGQPLAWRLAQSLGWSTLSLVCSRQTWFRDPYVYSYFNRLVDEGTLDEYDQVIFYGAESAGYAAAAYSISYPSAQVVLISPHASQNPDVAIWDKRHKSARRLNFSSPFGYAPAMAQAADRVTLLYDPFVDEDAMHAALFPYQHSHHIRLRHLGKGIERMLVEMDQFIPLIQSITDKDAAPSNIFNILKARKTYLPYLRSLLVTCDRSKRYNLAKLVCTHTLAHYNAPRFRKYLDLIEGQNSNTKDSSAG